MQNRKRWYLAMPLIAAAIFGIAGNAGAVTKAPPFKSAAFQAKHVFIIMLENKNFGDTFGTSTQDPYLQKTLVPQGTLLTQYFGTGHVSLDNYLSLISGQAPTPDTDNDCVPGLTNPAGGNFNTVAVTGRMPDPNHQIIAKTGCIYPKFVKTLPDHLTKAGLTWKGYMEDMGNDPAREASTCGHPVIGTGTDNTNSAEAPSAAVPLGDAYATRHNPFMYFHSIIDSPACKTNVVNYNQLAGDLASVSTTANFTFITPNLCHDGHDGGGTGITGTTCANGEPGGLTSADNFLKTAVPMIMNSPAYKQDGLLIITFDESNFAQSISKNGAQTVVNITVPGETCCNQQPGPNLTGARPITLTLLNTPNLAEFLVINGFGGDRVGALFLSKFVKQGGTAATPYNHYSLLRTLEDIFHVGPHLGYAADNPATGYTPGSIAKDPDVFVGQ